eukprot:TRINITY_DN2989_c0_g3_i1.p1 TRINITY_DN2989_c0_g3~~TRINITY_DN2989_c0_g3_i1.p1  ORF type:complete len:137 (-),score=24.47 TRINITY_DN2989_c0_g3_i1:56-466(-)
MKRLVKNSQNKEEANDVLVNYAKHNYNFERKMFSEQSNEIRKGNEWDETREEMAVMSAKLGLKGSTESSEVSSVLSGVGSFFQSLWNSISTTTDTTTTAAFTTDAAVTLSSPLYQRRERGDEVSNFLWNMRGANMI